MSAVSNADGRGVGRYVGVRMREIGDWEHGEIRLRGEVALRPDLAGPASAVATGPLLTMCDNVAGFCAGIAALPDGWVQTINMMLRRTRIEVVASELTFESTVVRVGRTSIVTDFAAADAEGLIASGMLTSAVLLPEGGPPQWDRPAAINSVVANRDDLPPFGDWLGIEVSPESPTVELVVSDDMRNPWGIVHGGVTASLIDACAMHAVPDAACVIDATVHYLAASKIGPLRAAATVLGRRGNDSVVRVSVHDDGVGRVTTVAVVTVRAS